MRYKRPSVTYMNNQRLDIHWQRFHIMLILHYIHLCVCESHECFVLNNEPYFMKQVGETQECVKCTSCPPGYGVTQRCSTNNDTVCSPCQDNMYSSRDSPYDTCLPCVQCTAHHATVRACTPSQDRLCSTTCDEGYYNDYLTGYCKVCSYCYPHDRSQIRKAVCQYDGAPVDFYCTQSLNGPYKPPPRWPSTRKPTTDSQQQTGRSLQTQSVLQTSISLSTTSISHFLSSTSNEWTANKGHTINTAMQTLATTGNTVSGKTAIFREYLKDSSTQAVEHTPQLQLWKTTELESLETQQQIVDDSLLGTVTVTIIVILMILIIISAASRHKTVQIKSINCISRKRVDEEITLI